MPATRVTPVDGNDAVILGGATSSGSPGFMQVQDGASTRLATVTAGNAVKTDGSAVTQPVSGTVTVNAGTGTMLVTSSGTTTTAVSAGTMGNTVIKASAGRLCRVLVTSTAGAATTAFYDNATTNSGTIIGIFPAATAAGTIGDFEMPAVNGITLAGAATNPAMTISFT